MFRLSVGAFIRRAAIFSGLSATMALPVSAQGSMDLAGTWMGTLKVQSQSLTLVLNVSSEMGRYAATLDSPDQGANGLPVSSISIDGDKVRIESALIKASFSGLLSADGEKIVGIWEQGGATLALVLEKT